MDIPGLVQTSLNLGILKLEEQAATLIFSVRSSVESEKEELGRRLRHMTEFLGGTCVQKGDYPGWEYRQESSLRDAMVSIYERMYGKKPRVLAIHAGLECGFFSGKMEVSGLRLYRPGSVWRSYAGRKTQHLFHRKSVRIYSGGSKRTAAGIE